VDAGLTLRETRLRLSNIGVRPEELTAIIITHEHTDHIKGLGPLGRAFRIPIYMTPLTRGSASGWLGKGLAIHEFEAGTAFDINGLHVEPFSIPHDAADPVGFAFHSGGYKAGLATDLGYAPHLVIERLKGVNLLILESNHDPDMLKSGPYPWPLKQRVAGKEGHLSNADACGLLAELIHEGLRHVTLAHLSQINNLPELAFRSAKCALLNSSSADVGLGVASQDRVGELVCI
jgi:phosphoribosyl 1,2-cyclic phosphodiesterase